MDDFKFFGEILIEEEMLTREKIDEGLKLQKDNPSRKLGEILVTLGYIEYEDITSVLKTQYKSTGNKPHGIGKWLSQEEIDKIIDSMSKEADD